MKLNMTLKNFTFVIFGFSILIISSCATYHLSTQSLLVQLAKSQPEKKVNFIIAFPIVFPGVVTGNSLTELKVLNKREQECVIPISRLTGVRITKKDGKRKTFYFDTLLVSISVNVYNEFGAMCTQKN